MARTPQYRGAYDMQERTRKERGFEKTESDLSGADFSAGVVKTIGARNKVQDVLSYFGNKNPFPRPVAADDTVWILDNTAYRNKKTARWEAEFVAAVFSQHEHEHRSLAVADVVSLVAGKMDIGDDDPACTTIRHRIAPFLQDIKPGATIKALHNGQTRLKLGPGGRNGISTDIKKLPGSPDGAPLVSTFAKVPKGANGLLESKTFYAEPEGWAVISDIDDTIKVTQTSDPIGILQTTFVDEPQVTPGMPELYRYIESTIGPTSPFFYLSASPYNLYPFLREFSQRHYPHGTIVLRDSSWMSIPGLLSNLTMGTEDYKVDRMRKIHGWLPRRKMICIGDSTQSDPESYGEIYRAHPGWVKLILIRKVEDIAAMGIRAKNEPDRFEKAFEGIPRQAWHVFTDAAECREIIGKLVGSQQ